MTVSSHHRLGLRVDGMLKRLRSSGSICLDLSMKFLGLLPLLLFEPMGERVLRGAMIQALRNDDLGRRWPLPRDPRAR